MERKAESSKIDVVCGMNLDKFSNITKISHAGKVFYFCSKSCENRFNKNPEKFQKEPLIKLRNVWKVFNMGEVKTKVLKSLNLNIWKGDFTAIIGSSGSGKSTVLNMIGLLDKPSSGKIFLRQKDVSLLKDDERAEFRSKTFGFVFQQYNLIPWLTAFENISLPLIFAGKHVDKDELEARFEEIGMRERMIHRPFELSGGEQQRVALLRALAGNPEIILGDEPTGNLDSATGDKILKILMKLNQEHGKTLIVVTHDADIAEMADQIIALKDGHLIQNHQSHKKLYTE